MFKKTLQVLVHFGYAFAFQIDSPYLESFNREMLVMQEKGIIKDLWNYFVEGIMMCLVFNDDFCEVFTK